MPGRPAFYINMVIDISPYCDCHAENDAAIVPDVGMFASFDPIALDVACADAVNRQQFWQEVCWTSLITKDMIILERFLQQQTGRSCVEHGAKIGLGTMEYDLIEV